MSDNPVAIKRLHGRIKWPSDVIDYHRTMAELICVANWEKYAQSEELRRRFFSTKGLLVESNTFGSAWGCGLNSDDDRATSRSTWGIGCLNLNGDLLSFVRHEMRSTEPYINDFAKMVLETVHDNDEAVTRDSTGAQKRPLETNSPDYNVSKRSALS